MHSVHILNLIGSQNTDYNTAQFLDHPPPPKKKLPYTSRVSVWVIPADHEMFSLSNRTCPYFVAFWISSGKKSVEKTTRVNSRRRTR